MSNRIPPEGSSRSERGATASRLPQQSELDNLLRETRRLLAGKRYQEVITRLEVHRPAEWTGLNDKGAKMLRLLAQAYLGEKRTSEARDCLEHLRAVLSERALLPKSDHSGVLSDLSRCYRELNLDELAAHCQEEARRILKSGE
mgnify:CR=1 FL=1